MSSVGFNIFVVIMFWCAVAIFGLAMGLMVLLLVFRIRAIARRRHTTALVSRWRAVFTGTLQTAPIPVSRGDAFTVLSLWNDFQRVRSSEQRVSSSSLTEVALAQNLPTLALRMLERGDAGDRIVSLTFLGYLRSATAEPQVRALLTDPIGEVALAAFRALLFIDRSAIKSFVFTIARRDDWPLSSVEQILQELGPVRISRSFAVASKDATDEQLLRLLPFFTSCEAPVAHAALCDLLAYRTAPAVLAGTLRALTPIVLAEDRTIVRPFLLHPIAYVRIAAIAAITPICEANDRDTLLQLLGDADSWVRYRAARALLDHFTRDGEASDLQRQIADRYAQDALKQVLAERSTIALRDYATEETGQDPGDRRLVERREIGAMRVGK